MSMTDPISDLLTRIRNAHLAKHDRLDVPVSRLKLEVCRLLKEEGFIKNFREVEGTTGPSKSVRIFLRYSPQGEPAINYVARVSKPGRRVYRRAGEIQPVRNGLGVVWSADGQVVQSGRWENGQLVEPMAAGGAISLTPNNP